MRRIGRYLYTFQPLRWLRNTTRVLRLVRGFNNQPVTDVKSKRFAILVAPWLGTDVPWFSLVFGLFLSRKGNEVNFIFDDLPFGNNPVRFNFIRRCVSSVMKRIAKRYPVIRLSDYSTAGTLSPSELEVINKLAAFNAVWALKGETVAKGRKSYVKTITRQLTSSYLAVKALMAANSFGNLFIPGGVYSSSGVWQDCASKAGIRVSSYDGGAHAVLLLCADGIAAQLQDIPRAFFAVKARPNFKSERKLIHTTALEEMRRRKSGTDQFSSQLSGIKENNLKFNNGVLIALNSSWDSAALGLHIVFDSSAQWIVETTRWLLDNTDSDVIIRQHPVERLAIARTTDDYRKLLSDNFRDDARVHFIAADALVNSYDLLNAVKTVVVYTSTIGSEAAVLGKVVLTPSRSYYSSLGFVWNADTREKYFTHLLNAVKGNYSVSGTMKDDAICCYYLTQCCNWISTTFNPSDFSDWSDYSLADLYMLESVQLSLDSIQDNVPAAVLNHLVRLKNEKTTYRESV